MKIARDLTDLIGNTPLLSISRYTDGADATVLAKCEFMNPYSVKDRPVLYMLRQAEKEGVLPPGGMIVEATSGNTGIALASQATIRGYQVVLVMSEISSMERRQVLAALGAELILTPQELGTKGARAKAKEIAEERGAFYIGQHDNPANPLAHAETTAEELWRDTDGTIDIFVAVAGTTGTLVGVSRALRPLKPEIRIIGVEPETSPFLKEGIFRPHKMTGAAPGFTPGVYDAAQIDDIVLVDVEDAFEACRELARTEGILAGVTSGASALAARRLAQDPQNAGKTIVCLLCDSGERYLSMGFFGAGPAGGPAGA